MFNKTYFRKRRILLSAYYCIKPTRISRYLTGNAVCFKLLPNFETEFLLLRKLYTRFESTIYKKKSIPVT